MLHKCALIVQFSMPSMVFADEAEAEAAEAEAMEAEVVENGEAEMVAENGEAEAAEPVVPSVTVYGAIRSAKIFGGGKDARSHDGVSLWGITGTSPVAEGLTAFYRFESSISSLNAAAAGGRHAHVGLSGGFGTVTLGQQGTAAASAIGGNDKSNYFGASGLEATRHGNAVSYGFSTGGIGFMADVQMDGATDTGGHIDKSEIGLTMGLGEFGTLGVGYVNQKNSMKANPDEYEVITTAAAEDKPAVYSGAKMIKVKVAKNSEDINADKDEFTSVDSIARDTKGMYSTGDGCSDTETAANACITVNAYSVTTTSVPSTPDSGRNVVVTNESFYAMGRKTAATVLDTAGYKASHVRYEFGVGGLTSWVGHSQKKVNGAANKSKTTHFGLKGAMGDTGLSFVVMGRRVKDADGENTNPWLFAVNRDLGGGASVHLEHGNNDDGESGMTAVGLNVAF